MIKVWNYLPEYHQEKEEVHAAITQVLESGWLWGGRTARAIARLDERKLDLLRRSAITYREYARGFAQSQAAAAAGLGSDKAAR